MALNFSSVEILSRFSAPSMAVPLIPTAANWSIHTRKLRSVLARSALPSPAHLFGDSESGASSNNKEQITTVVQKAKVQERDYIDTPYGPVYVTLPLGTINMEGELVDTEDLINQLRILKSINVDGFMVECWWGIVEAHTPQEYNWNGYKKLFQIVRDLNLKLQCYDKYLMKSLNNAALPKSDWAKAPENAGSYNSKPHKNWGSFAILMMAVILNSCMVDSS